MSIQLGKPVDTQQKLLGIFTAAPMSPALKYVGFALLWAWHCILWFVPHIFTQVELLDEQVTISWLINLGGTVFFLFLIAFTLGRKYHLSFYKWLYIAAPILICVATLLLCLSPQSFATPQIAYLLSFFLGAAESVLWILWGEYYASVKANYSIRHIGTTFGFTVFLTVILSWALPSYIATAFVSVLPLISGALLVVACRKNKQVFPTLLPKAAAQAGLKNMVAVGTIMFLASMACCFLGAIIPWEPLPTGNISLTIGILNGAVIMLVIAGIATLWKDHLNIFKLFPWLIVLEIVAFSLFLADEVFFFSAFILVTGISSLLEILLIMYFGILTSKGYATPAVTFAFSGAFVRAGIAVGNTWAIIYEHTPSLAAAVVPETCLGFICLLTALLIPLVRREFSISALTTTLSDKAEIDEICAEVAKEFCLSNRESQILTLIAQGYATNNIAKKLVISPYTVNTHIRHIYEKIQIHKRSELLDYLNVRHNNS